MVNLEEKFARVVEAVPVGANAAARASPSPTSTIFGNRLIPSPAPGAPAFGASSGVGRIGFGFGSGRNTVVDQPSLISDGYVLNRLRGPVHDVCSTVSQRSARYSLPSNANGPPCDRPQPTCPTFCPAASPHRHPKPTQHRRACHRRHRTPRFPFNISISSVICSSLDSCHCFLTPRQRRRRSRPCSRICLPAGAGGSTPCRNTSTRAPACIPPALPRVGIGRLSISPTKTRS